MAICTRTCTVSVGEGTLFHSTGWGLYCLAVCTSYRERSVGHITRIQKRRAMSHGHMPVIQQWHCKVHCCVPQKREFYPVAICK